MRDISTEAQLRHHLATGLLTVLLGSALPTIGSALPGGMPGQGSDDQETLFIGNINGDGIADTLFGSITTGAQYRATHIAWGAYRAPGSTAIPTIRRTTRFRYPDWSTAGGSISISDINADSLADMVLYLWEDRTTERSEPRSTSFILLGAPGADTVVSIDLGGSARQERGAFRPIPVSRGGLLVDRAMRDHSRIASYVRLPPGTSPEDERPRESAVAAEPEPQVRLYPNPTDNRVEIQANGLAAGVCTIITLDLDGRQIRTDRSEVGDDGHLTMTLDLGAIPSGYYVVRIDDNEKVVRSLPLLVVH